MWDKKSKIYTLKETLEGPWYSANWYLSLHYDGSYQLQSHRCDWSKKAWSALGLATYIVQELTAYSNQTIKFSK